MQSADVGHEEEEGEPRLVRLVCLRNAVVPSCIVPCLTTTLALLLRGEQQHFIGPTQPSIHPFMQPPCPALRTI